MGERDGSAAVRPGGVVVAAPHLRMRNVGLVAVGGAVGTYARYVLSVVVPDWGNLPIVIALINVTGASVLGFLLARLSCVPKTERRAALGLFAGTGVLGGFTTYSTFTVDEDGLFDAGDVADGLLFGVPTIALGVGAALLGAALARRTGSRNGAVG